MVSTFFCLTIVGLCYSFVLERYEFLGFSFFNRYVFSCLD